MIILSSKSVVNYPQSSFIIKDKFITSSTKSKLSTSYFSALPYLLQDWNLTKNILYKQRTHLLHQYAGSNLENMKGYHGSNDDTSHIASPALNDRQHKAHQKGQPASQTVEAKLKAITICHLTKSPGLILSNFIEFSRSMQKTISWQTSLREFTTINSRSINL